MSGILRTAIARQCRALRNSTRGYADGGLMEQTGRPPKMYVGVEKAPKIPGWEKGVAFTIMMIGALGYPSWVLYNIPNYKARNGDE